MDVLSVKAFAVSCDTGGGTLTTDGDLPLAPGDVSGEEISWVFFLAQLRGRNKARVVGSYVRCELGLWLVVEARTILENWACGAY